MKHYYEKPSRHKDLGTKLGSVLGGLAIIGMVFVHGKTIKVNKLPTENVTVTNNSPDNSIDGIISAVDGNNLSGPVFNDIQDYLLKQNHNSAAIHAGQVFKVPIVEQSHPPGHNSDSKK